MDHEGGVVERESGVGGAVAAAPLKPEAAIRFHKKNGSTDPPRSQILLKCGFVLVLSKTKISIGMFGT